MFASGRDRGTILDAHTHRAAIAAGRTIAAHGIDIVVTLTLAAAAAHALRVNAIRAIAYRCDGRPLGKFELHLTAIAAIFIAGAIAGDVRGPRISPETADTLNQNTGRICAAGCDVTVEDQTDLPGIATGSPIPVRARIGVVFPFTAATAAIAARQKANRSVACG